MAAKHYCEYVTIFDFIDEADAAGVFRFVFPKDMEYSLPAGPMAALAYMMQCRFMNLQYVDVRMRRGTKWLQDFEAMATKNGDGRWECRINLAKALLLPGAAPAAELKELRAFFERCLEHVKAVGGERSADVQFTNDRDNHGRVYGGVRARQSIGEHRMEELAETTAKLRAIASDSPVITAWLREMALALGKVGPHSWWTASENFLLPEEERPHRKFLIDKSRRERAQASGKRESRAHP
ncbi:hypothetical protein ABIC83_002542 [Roseateles asaccharophilus]|uniref:hypothetical protein n=1 Tax=Roseateles asaccharophilus TaxID=582607 RepID=UPI0038352C90